MKAALLSLLLTGCAADPYGWYAEPSGPALPVIHVPTAQSELADACRNAHPQLYGCARRTSGFCFIYTEPDPPAWLMKHELMHCAGYRHAYYNGGQQ
jgi:hypothetical protein